jgi:hypothetical protein
MPAKQDLWVRNLHHIPASITLASGRKIALGPRGQRGDSAPISKTEQNDEIFLANTDLIFEVITKAEAQKAIAKQTTNQQAVHPAMQTVRNELGEEYENTSIVVEKPFEEQSVTVAQTDNGQIIIDRGIGIRRFEAPGTTGYELEGDVVRERQQAQETAANAQSLEDALGGAKVKVEKPQQA